MPPSHYDAATTTVPVAWKVVELVLGTVVLGDLPTDSHRIVLCPFPDEDGQIEASVVYPCGACGWAAACGENGADCHV